MRSLPPLRYWLAVEYVWVIVPYMIYDVCVMYLCHWHKSKDTSEKQHSLASVRSFLEKDRLMVTHHLFILVVLTPVAQVGEAVGITSLTKPKTERDSEALTWSQTGSNAWAHGGLSCGLC